MTGNLWPYGLLFLGALAFCLACVWFWNRVTYREPVERTLDVVDTVVDRNRDTAREAPGTDPAAPITLPHIDTHRCPVCLEPLPVGVSHYCGRGADYRPQRTVA